MENAKTTAEGTKHPAPAVSFFRDDENFFSDTAQIDGEEFFIREMSPETQAKVEGLAKHLADTYQLDIAKLSDAEYMAANIEVGLEIKRENQELYEQVVQECLVNWTLPRECNSTNKALLSKRVKRILAERVLEVSNFVVVEEDFTLARSRRSSKATA